MQTTELETEYWDLLPKSGPAEREALAETNYELAERLARLLAVLDQTPAVPIFIGAYPAASFQAVSVQTTFGTIILVHQKLIGVARAVAAPLARLLGVERAGIDDNLEETRRKARWMVRWVISSFVTHEDFGGLIVELSDEGEQFFNILSGGLMNFVVAHELAHTTLGHFSNTERLAASMGEKAKISLPSWRTEVAADLEGLRIADRSYKRLALEARYLGPALFFEIEDMARRMRVAQRPAPAYQYDLEHVNELMTHPHAHMRLTALISESIEYSKVRDMHVLRWLVNTMRKMSADSPQGDQEALAALEPIARLLSIDEYISFMGIVEEQGGVTMTDMSKVYERMGESHANAQAAIALAAINLSQSDPLVIQAPRVHLGLLYAVYMNIYLTPKAQKEAEEFDVLVRKAIPDLDDLVMLVAQQARGQTESQ